FHFEHAPLHLQLLELLPSGEIAKHGNGVCDLTAGVIDFSRARVVFDFSANRRIVKMENLDLEVEKREGESGEKRVQLGLVLDDLRLADSGRCSQQFLGERIKQNDLGSVIGDNNRIAYILDDEIQAVAVLANDFFCRT